MGEGGGGGDWGGGVGGGVQLGWEAHKMKFTVFITRSRDTYNSTH